MIQIFGIENKFSFMANCRFELIAGIVNDLTLQDGQQPIASNVQKRAGATGAILLASHGLTGASQASASASASDPVELFMCTIGGRPVAGRFSKVTFQNGEYVEAVVEQSN